MDVALRKSEKKEAKVNKNHAFEAHKAILNDHQVPKSSAGEHGRNVEASFGNQQMCH